MELFIAISPVLDPAGYTTVAVAAPGCCRCTAAGVRWQWLDRMLSPSDPRLAVARQRFDILLSRRIITSGWNLISWLHFCSKNTIDMKRAN